MKKKDLIKMLEGFPLLEGLKGAKFSYGIAKNKRIIEEEITILRETFKPSKEYEDFNKKRIELCVKHSTKGKDSNPVMIKDPITKNEVFSMVGDDKKKFNSEFDKLKKENIKFIDENDKQMLENEELLKEESNINLFKIKSVDIPDEISCAQMDIILELIEE